MSLVFRPRLTVPDPVEIESIITEATRILEKIGVLIENTEGQAILRDAGAKEADGRFFISETMTRDALARVPSTFHLFDRDGQPAVEVGGDSTCYYPGATAVNLYESGKNARRPTTARDLANLVRQVECLPHYGCQGTAVLPSDVPDELGDRYRLYLVLKYSKKPVITGTFRKDGFAPMHRMLSAVRGGAEALAEKPMAAFVCCPSPPLKWSDLTCQALIDCARNGVPSIPLAMPLTGATGPVTLRETIVQHCAENFSGFVLAQAAHRGAKVIFGGAPSAFDMRRGTTTMGAIETAQITLGYTQVAQHLRIPTHSYLGASDSKLTDYQAGMESAIEIVLAALVGVNFAAGCGMLDFLLTQSLEKILLDHEACAMAKRLVQGIEKKPVELLPLMAELIRAGSLLTHKHTRANWRSELMMPSTIIDRDSYGEWEKQGSMSIAQRAAFDVEKRLANTDPAPMDAERLTRLQDIITAEMVRCGRSQLPAEK